MQMDDMQMDDIQTGSPQQAGQNAKPKLLDAVRGKMRMLHLAKRTEEAYLGWILDFLKYSRNRGGSWVHPLELGDSDIEAYLTFLAVERRVAASTQNQSLSALLFLYQKVLDRPFRVDAVRAKRSEKLPEVLTPAEIRLVFQYQWSQREFGSAIMRAVI